MNRDVQLTSDGHPPYVQAILEAFGPQANYAMVAKQYEGSRYVGSETARIAGKPDMELVSTSGVERFNLTLRSNQRRFVRKTNAYSKKVRNHALAAALMSCTQLHPHPRHGPSGLTAQEHRELLQRIQDTQLATNSVLDQGFKAMSLHLRDVTTELRQPTAL